MPSLYSALKEIPKRYKGILEGFFHLLLNCLYLPILFSKLHQIPVNSTDVGHRSRCDHYHAYPRPPSYRDFAVAKRMLNRPHRWFNCCSQVLSYGTDIIHAAQTHGEICLLLRETQNMLWFALERFCWTLIDRWMRVDRKYIVLLLVGKIIGEWTGLGRYAWSA